MSRPATPLRSLSGLVALALLCFSSALSAKPRLTDTLPSTTVKDLHYGEVLFYYFQDDYFGALTRLRAAQEKKRVSHHEAEAELLLGGLYLSYGQHLEAGVIFERLLTQDISPSVRNRAWFYLGKVWYQRGYWSKAEAAFRKVEGAVSENLSAELHNLLAQVLIQQGRYDDAVVLLRGWKGLAVWNAYGQFNLGVALVRKGQLADGAPYLDTVGRMDANTEELLALRDKANLALGYAYIQNNKPEDAKPVLQRVRLTGPQSNKALLAIGWAESASKNYRDALNPWMELHDRNLLDAAVQESYLAVPYAFSRLGANAQAAEYYTSAIQSYSEEAARLDTSIASIRAGHLLDVVAPTHEGEKREETKYGWFWQLEKLPNAPETRYLYHLLAGHEFQEGLKNYRDLGFMQRNLEEWSRSLEAFDDMLDTRRVAYQQRLPKVDATLARNDPDTLSESRMDLESQLNAAERSGDFVALGTAREQEMWSQIREIEEALAAQPDDPSLEVTRDKLRLLKGVLSWRLNESFKARTWSTRRSLKELDVALKEMQKRWQAVQNARRDMPQGTDEFAARVAALQPRIEALMRRLASAGQSQQQYLANIAIRELEQQKQRLADYQLQARYALATIYDRASNPPPSSDKAAPAVEQRQPQ